MRLALVCSLLLASAAKAEITDARYLDPTDRYGHGVVPGGEYDRLQFRLSGDRIVETSPIADSVYEDTQPRLIDVDGDGSPEVMAFPSAPVSVGLPLLGQGIWTAMVRLKLPTLTDRIWQKPYGSSVSKAINWSKSLPLTVSPTTGSESLTSPVASVTADKDRKC